MDLHHIVDGLSPSGRSTGKTTKVASNQTSIPPFASLTKLCTAALLKVEASSATEPPTQDSGLPNVALQPTPPLDGPASPSHHPGFISSLCKDISAAPIPALASFVVQDGKPTPPFMESQDAPIVPFSGGNFFTALVPPPIAIPAVPFSPPPFQPCQAALPAPQIMSPVEEIIPAMVTSWRPKRTRKTARDRTVVFRPMKNLPASPPVSPEEDSEDKQPLMVREKSPSRIPVVATLRVGSIEVDAATKRFGCQTCGRTFMRKSDLVRHERIHTGHRPNMCGVCGKRFIQRSALNVHLRVHTGEKPYRCRICLRPFSDSSSLARHRKLHSQKMEDAAVLHLTDLTDDHHLCHMDCKDMPPSDAAAVASQPK